MAIDLRNYQETIKNTVAEINKSANYKWNCKTRKNHIELTNQYIKGQYERDYFKVEVTEVEDTVIVKLYDTVYDDAYTMYFVDEPNYKWDGSIEECIAKAIRSCESHFNHIY